jgi:hypothetical protein
MKKVESSVATAFPIIKKPDAPAEHLIPQPEK